MKRLHVCIQYLIGLQPNAIRKVSRSVWYVKIGVKWVVNLDSYHVHHVECDTWTKSVLFYFGMGTRRIKWTARNTSSASIWKPISAEGIHFFLTENLNCCFKTTLSRNDIINLCQFVFVSLSGSDLNLRTLYLFTLNINDTLMSRYRSRYAGRNTLCITIQVKFLMGYLYDA